jgi:hypothetical protein
LWGEKGVRPLLELSVTKLEDFSGF